MHCWGRWHGRRFRRPRLRAALRVRAGPALEIGKRIALPDQPGELRQRVVTSGALRFV
jgi:hypothetical protein